MGDEEGNGCWTSSFVTFLLNDFVEVKLRAKFVYILYVEMNGMLVISANNVFGGNSYLTCN